MKADHERVSKLLTDTVTLLCKNGVSYDQDLKIQALIAITIDGKDVFVVQVNESFPSISQTLLLPAESTQSSAPLQCESLAPSSKRRARSEDVVDLTRLVETPMLHNQDSFLQRYPTDQPARIRPAQNMPIRKTMPSKSVQRATSNSSARHPSNHRSTEKQFDPRLPPEIIRPSQMRPNFEQMYPRPASNRNAPYIDSMENAMNQMQKAYQYPLGMAQNLVNSVCPSYKQTQPDMRLFPNMENCQGSLQQIMEFENFARNQEMMRISDPFLKPYAPDFHGSSSFFRPMMPPQSSHSSQKNVFSEAAPPRQKSPRVRITEQHVDLCSETDNIFENAILHDISSMPHSSIVIQPDDITDNVLVTDKKDCEPSFLSITDHAVMNDTIGSVDDGESVLCQPNDVVVGMENEHQDLNITTTNK